MNQKPKSKQDHLISFGFILLGFFFYGLQLSLVSNGLFFFYLSDQAHISIGELAFKSYNFEYGFKNQSVTQMNEHLMTAQTIGFASSCMIQGKTKTT